MALRPSLPTSSSDFALHPTASSNADEFNPLLMRFRRPSLLAPPRDTFYSEGRLHSPLAGSSFTVPMSRRHTTSSTASGEESESDKEKMWTDSASSNSSGANTPSLALPIASPDKHKSTSSLDSDSSMKSMQSHPLSSPGTVTSTKTARPSSPSPPPRLSSNRDSAPETPPPKHSRRISHSIKPPRILNLLSESRPEENEVKSEAQFQRFVASLADCPTQPRTPRALSDRGRYPEEAGLEEPTREDTPSDDEEGFEFQPFSYTGISEPISIVKPVTPAHSVYGGEDIGLSESPGNMAMDIDTQPPSTCGSPKLNTSSWRYTPPPTSSSAVRSAKRKLEDRYDPYPSAKRRAVSPSVSYLRESLSHTPRTPGNGRVTLPLPHPIAIPVLPSSSASSPVVTPSAVSGPRSMSWSTQSVLSSPTLRAQIGLSSPILRPMMRRREEGKEVDGAGDGVYGLSLE